MATIQTSATINNNANKRLEIWKKRLRNFGISCFNKMDYIGGYVAYFLGVEESRYQWVIDSMDEEDIERAKQDYIERKERDQVLFAEMGIDTGLRDDEENTEDMEASNVNEIVPQSINTVPIASM